MATAAAMCRPHASEARRPEAGSRAVGVSRAERGNDGSPKGRDAAGGSMRSTTARPAMFRRGRPFNQRWTYRLDARMKCYWFARVSASAQPGNGIEQCQAQRPSWGKASAPSAPEKRVGPKEKALNGRRTVTALSSPATAKTRRVERSHMAACLRSATANISRSVR